MSDTRGVSVRGQSILAMLLAALSMVGVSFAVWTARTLRPVADDYCLAVAADEGFPDAVISWFLGWSGDLYVTTINLSLVGLPGANLPWSLASMMPFVLAAIAVSAAVIVLFRMATPQFQVRWTYDLLTVPTLMLAWWAFWWLPVMMDSPHDDGDATSLEGSWALSITFWQNINSAYVIAPALLVVAAALLAYRAPTRTWKQAVGWITIGTLVGFSGPVAASSSLVMVALFAITRAAARDLRAYLPRLFSFVAGLLPAAIIAYLAPGTQARAQFLTSAPIHEMQGVADLVAFVLPEAIVQWAELLLRPSSGLVALLVGLAAVLLIKRNGSPLKARPTVVLGTWLLVFSLTLSTVSRLSEAFSYDGFWHAVLPGLFAFMGVALLGVALSIGLSNRSVALEWAWIGGGILALTVSLMSVGTMAQEMHARYVDWTQGPAPAGPIPDVEATDGWVYDCWRNLSDVRQLPPRG